jgi:hypothetical protein
MDVWSSQDESVNAEGVTHGLSRALIRNLGAPESSCTVECPHFAVRLPESAWRRNLSHPLSLERARGSRTMSLRMGGVLRASRKMTEGERGIAVAARLKPGP